MHKHIGKNKNLNPNAQNIPLRIVIFSVLCLFIVSLIAYFGYAIHVYKDDVTRHMNSYEPLMLHVDDFDGLTCTEYTMTTEKDHTLTGYWYSTKQAELEQRGIIVLAHGYGRGHNPYMNCANYFAQHGYFVFAYDVTGNDKSQGVGTQNGIGGFPQSVIDLDAAISFVQNSGNFPTLPIGLFGHSWGGYSVSSVLTYHPEVQGVIECSGCNTSYHLFEILGKSDAGNAVYSFTPAIKIYEYLKYNDYAANTAIDGFEATDAPIMVVHGTKDKVVPTSYGYDLYYEKYKNNPRFSFMLFEDKGHNDFFFKENNKYKKDLDASIDAWAKTLEYDYTDEANKKRFSQDKAAFINEQLDRKEWANRLDEDLFAQFLEFYDTHVREE